MTSLGVILDTEENPACCPLIYFPPMPKDVLAQNSQQRTALPAVPGYRVFWEARGKGCFWMTKTFGYRLGALLAIPCHRLGLAPNAVTVLSFLTALTGVVLVTGEWIESRVIQAILLWIFLTISYAFDCADGTLARVTGKSSSFGFLWDKLVDMATLIVISGMLGYAALDKPFGLLPVHWRPFLFFWSIAPRCVFNTFLWLKDSQRYGMTRPTEERSQDSTAWKLKRAIGNLIDEPSYYLALAVFWSLGLYWTFVLLYSTAISLVLAAYVLSTRRELAAMDAAARSQDRQSAALPEVKSSPVSAEG